MSNILTNEQKVDTDSYQAEHSKSFRAACDRAGIPATGRQFAKYRRGLGLAYKHRKK